MKRHRDPDIRAALKNKFPEYIIALDEVGVLRGRSIIDVMTLNPKFNTLSGYEIKSDYDTLDRLPGQMVDYNKVFDYVYLVAGSRHLDEAAEIIPDFWGVVEYCEGELIQLRKPEPNPFVQPKYMAQWLWREELLRILRDKGIRGISDLNKAKLMKLLISKLTQEELKSKIMECMLSREEWKSPALN